MNDIKIPDKETLTEKLRLLISIHPIRPVRLPGITFIYLSLLDEYPGIISYTELDDISKRKKSPEQIAEAILIKFRQQITQSGNLTSCGVS
jgi:hypothetical protein